ncbi:MAG: hypothetical protein LBP59_01260 [Planctomycetaceae bacterium]|jgi:3-oxoacyl-(acyl-carrier-protein) synthase|nr:hypothetical protein [Planctomycetaceae bacterium]
MKDSLFCESVAVVSLSCRLPGAGSPQEFWQMLINGESPICEVPETWLNHHIYFDPQPGKTGKTYSKLGAIFDSTKIENEIQNYKFPEQFRNCDPLLKLACIVADEVVGGVKIPTGADNFGVYLGGLRSSDLSHDYIFSIAANVTFNLLYETPEFSKLPAGVQQEIISNCIAAVDLKYRNENYWHRQTPEFRIGDFAADLRNIYRWTGAAYSLDAACASSLVAVDCARADILAGKIQGALVGGISAMTMLTPVLFSKNFAATAELSRPFDAAADGMVGSMGIVFIFLKPLSIAERDGDTILGLIRGVGFASDGRGKSLWAPRAEGELLAMKRAYCETGITPQQLTYLEAHATSTNVGDSTELKSIENLLKYTADELSQNYTQLSDTPDNFTPNDFLYENKSTNSNDDGINVTKNIDTKINETKINVTKNHVKRKLAIGSVKANFGHTFEAAGLVGLMKILQICRNKTIPPQINISQLHPDICNRQLPFFIPLELTQLTDENEDENKNEDKNENNTARFYAVNAFGVGGLNAHLILQDYKKNNTPKLDQNILQELDQNKLQDKQQTPKAPQANKRKSIAVIGMGCVYPRAFSVEQFNTILNQKIDPKQTLSSFELKRRFFAEQKDGDETVIFGGFIEDYLYDWELHKIPPLQIQRCDPLQTFVMGAVDEAMQSAIPGRKLSDEERDKTFVVAGAEHLSNFFYEYQLGMRAQEVGKIARDSARAILLKNDNLQKTLADQFDFSDVRISADFDLIDYVSDKISKNFIKKIHREYSCISDVTGGFSSSSLASRITKLYDLHGGAFTIDGGLPSSLIAIDYSLQKLRGGDGLFGICIGAYRWTNSHAFEFYKLRYPSGVFPLAEGAGAVVMKLLEHVDLVKEKPLGLIYEIIRISNGELDKAAWDLLNLSASDLAFISITSPLLCERLGKIGEFFRNEKRVEPVPVTTCCDQFGNFCDGAGMAELIKTFLILRNGVIPAQFDWNETSDLSDLADIFFVTKNPIELNLDENSFALLFDLDDLGNGYAAVILPYIEAKNSEVEIIKSDVLKPRNLERGGLTQFLRDDQLGENQLKKDQLKENQLVNAGFSKRKRVYVYRQVGTSYESGFGLGVSDVVGIENLIKSYDAVLSGVGGNEIAGINYGAINYDNAINYGDEINSGVGGVSIGGSFEFGVILSRARELFGDNGIDELRGISDGAGVPFEKLFLHNIKFYSGLTGVQFLLRDAGIFKHVIILENSLREIIGDSLDVHLLECEPAADEAYLKVAATGCIGGFAAIRAGLSAAILPQIKNINAIAQQQTKLNLNQFVNIASLLNNQKKIINQTKDVLIVDAINGNRTNNANISEHNLTTTQNLIKKFSQSPRYIATIITSKNNIEIF